MEGPNPLHRTSLIAEWTTIQQKTYHLSHCNALARVTMGGGTASAIEPTHFSYAFLSRGERSVSTAVSVSSSVRMVEPL